MVALGSFTQSLNALLQSNLVVGLHFNITEGRPITTDGGAIRSLLDDGQFKGKWNLLENVSTLVEKEIETELVAQLECFRAAFKRLPNHVDGHNHCHVLSDVVARVVARTMRAYSIERIRLPLELPSRAIQEWLDARSAAADDKQFGARLRRTADFNVLVVRRAQETRAIFDEFRLAYSDRFIGLYLLLAAHDGVDTHRRLLTAQLAEVARGASDGDPTQHNSIELMCHPGFAEAAGANIDEFSSSDERAVELRSLCALKETAPNVM